MAMQMMMGHVLCLLSVMLYSFCGSVMANQHQGYRGVHGAPGLAGVPGGVYPDPLGLHAGIPGVPGVGVPPKHLVPQPGIHPPGGIAGVSGANRQPAWFP
ncbi:uncharacterized protein TM35_000501100, partial [Trypanosoma theileri]